MQTNLWLDSPHSMRPAGDTSFSLLGDKPVLFSEFNQKIYELNEMAAFIWCYLSDGKSTEAIVSELSEMGLSREESKNYVVNALRAWFDLGLLVVDWRFHESMSTGVRIGGVSISIQSSNKHLAEIVASIFDVDSPEILDPEGAAEQFEIVEYDGVAHVFQNKKSAFICPLEELAPALKALLTQHIIGRDASQVAFHAACLVFRGRALLLGGEPGAGKTTLSMHLLAAGFEYGGDDIVLISGNGRVEAIPFAATVKEGAWDLVGKFRADLGRQTIHKRGDGVLVRYLRSSHPARAGAYPVGWIVSIRRTENVPTSLSQLEQVDSMKKCIEGSFVANGKMTQEAFRAIKQTLKECNSYELAYSQSADAKDAIVRLCNG